MKASKKVRPLVLHCTHTGDRSEAPWSTHPYYRVEAYCSFLVKERPIIGEDNDLYKFVSMW